MRFVTFKVGDQVRIGISNQEVSEIIDIKDLEMAKKGMNSLPNTMIEAMSAGEEFLNEVKKLLEFHESQDNQKWVYRMENNEVELLAPIPRTPKNVLCLGKNYLAHALELGSADDVPKHPMVFTKAATAINGPYDDVLSHSDLTEALDYEAELAIVIGKRGSKISNEDALDYVFGYTIINDVTARDLQTQHKQFFLGKSLDTSCPMGPFIAHKSIVEDPENLQIETLVNGEVRQSSKTDQFIFDIPTMISVISQGTTLEPGDVIATGTPAGVGKGFNPPKYLKAGDIVEIKIEGLGVLRNRIV